MRKMIFMAIAGFLWKKYQARKGTTRPVTPTRRW